MNSIYRIVWNAAIGKWVVASELATGRTKQGCRRAARGLAAAGLLMLALPLWAADAEPARCELPTDQTGVRDAQGRCVAIDADANVDTAPLARTIGVQAAVDDQYVKVNGSGTAATAAGIGAIAIGNNARALADADGNADNAIALGRQRDHPGQQRGGHRHGGQRQQPERAGRGRVAGGRRQRQRRGLEQRGRGLQRQRKRRRCERRRTGCPQHCARGCGDGRQCQRQWRRRHRPRRLLPGYRRRFGGDRPHGGCQP
ncbi:ESPR domain-containing protein [Stenotrophomonas sp.]|uniref:ESPR domain-containing protein n=1 Tax=Stenotrophomonas sp. TaxID=69392 RepID=UPI002FC5FAE9